MNVECKTDKIEVLAQAILLQQVLIIYSFKNVLSRRNLQFLQLM